MPVQALKRASVPAWRNLNTPQTLWTGLYIVWALDVLLLIAAIAGVRVHRHAMQTIGREAAPTIIAAQHIESASADMDAIAAGELLGPADQVLDSVEPYESRRKEADMALVAAARNIAYPGEQELMDDLEVAMGTYAAKVQRARDLRVRGDAGYVEAYREAAGIMDHQILAKAEALDEVNRKALDEAYGQQSGRSVATIVFIVLTGAMLVAALVAIQRFLYRRMRRILNPMLALSTLVTLGLILYTLNILGSERHDLKVARVDAFTSIHALWRARAAAYSAKGDERRYLLDPADAPVYEQNFQEKALALAAVPPGSSFEKVLASSHDGWRVDGFTGYLAQELDNITFEGERELAVAELARFVDYLNVDAEIRRLQQDGKHAEALTLCLGTNVGESEYAFEQFDQALGRTLDLNQSAFDYAVGMGFSALSDFEIKASIIAIAIALLGFLGLKQRIREYQ